MIADKYRLVFLDETSELVEKLANVMMLLEDSDEPGELVREAFRHAHSIKGSAATLSVAAIVTVSHVIEDRLQVATETHSAPPSSEIDLLLEAVEAIGDLLGAVADGSTPEVPEELMVRLSLLSGAAPAHAVSRGAAERLAYEPAADAKSVPGSVRVPVADLDKLMDLVSELVIARGQLERHGVRVADRDLSDTIATSSRLLADIQGIVARSRMTSLDDVFGRMQRLVRNTARELGVPVEFEVVGRETELDRLMVAGVTDPLVHLLRNAVDHGVEPKATRLAAGKPERGQITLSATYEANMVLLSVSDDGAGIGRDRLLSTARAKGLIGIDDPRPRDNDLIELIFHPGFSTRAESNEISGRGVGMDIVRSTIRRLGGSIEVRSTEGTGTTFDIRLPLSLAVIEALLVDLAGDTWAVPLSQVIETVTVEPSMLRPTLAADAMVLRGEMVPIIHVGPLFGVSARLEAPYPAVVFRQRGSLVALAVNALHRKTEIVVKPVPPLLGDLAHIAGTTILGDGSVGLILDLTLLSEVVSLGSAA